MERDPRHASAGSHYLSHAMNATLQAQVNDRILELFGHSFCDGNEHVYEKLMEGFVWVVNRDPKQYLHAKFIYPTLDVSGILGGEQ